VAEATRLLYGRPLWWLSDVLDRLPTNWRIATCLCILLIAAGATMAASVRKTPSWPLLTSVRLGFFTFKNGLCLSGAMALLTSPWTWSLLFSDANRFLFVWLLACSAVLGAVTGVNQPTNSAESKLGLWADLVELGVRVR